MRALLCALVACAVLVTGCRSEPDAVATTEPPPAEPTPDPTPEPTIEPAAWLTGGDASPELLGRPVLAVKIDNAPAARPQSGLEDADIVYTELVEGGATRFIALLHSSLPQRLGPVRSGREVDADLLPAYQPVFALSGAAGVVHRLFAEVGLETYEEEDEIDGFSRDGSRRAPYNLYLDPQALLDAVPHVTVLEDYVFAFDETPPDGGTDTTGADLRFSRYSTAAWSFDADDERWLRSQDGTEHVSADGQRLGADNVVILEIAVSEGDRTDAGGNRTVDLEVLGQGEGVVLRDGEAFEVTWRKDDRDAPLELVDDDGAEVALRPGVTWIELLPLEEGDLGLDQPDASDS